MYLGDTTPDLARRRDYVRAMMVTMRDRGSVHLGRVQTYAAPDVARKFTDQFRAILRAAETWLAAANRALREGAPPEVLTALDASRPGLCNPLRDFDRRVWWESPTKALAWIAAPFKVAGSVAASVASVAPKIGKVLLTAGSSVLSTAGFVSRLAGPLLLLGVAGYFLLPWGIKTFKAARA